MHHRLPTLLSTCALLAGCAGTPRTDTAPQPADDLVAELLEAATRRPVPPVRVGERETLRARSRGLADVDLPAVVPDLEVRMLDELGAPLGATPARLRVVRFPDVIHLTSPDGGDEWLFHRNRVATDEVTGERVDHGSRFVIEYTDSELAAESVLDGWARLAQLFVAPEELDRLRPTGEVGSFAGHEFERRVRDRDAAVGDVLEVEWSDALALPRRVVWRAAHGTRVQELVALRPALEGDLPTPFAERWPDYDHKDLSDWREDIHGHVDGHDHATH